MKIKKIDHVVITASDAAKSVAFYEMLGFQPRAAAGRYELFAGDFKINVHQKGQELEPKAQKVQTGSADLCFEVDGTAEGWEKHLFELGITVELGPVDRMGALGKMRSVYFRDPDGNLLELCCYDVGIC